MLKRALTGSLACAAFTAPAQAQETSSWQVSMTSDGRASFGVPPAPPGHEVTVHRCPGGGVCGAALTYLPKERYGTTRWVDPRAIRTGDVLEVRLTHDGTLLRAQRTAAWRGTPLRVAPPTLTGSLAVGEPVRLTPGTWTDAGWAPGWGLDWQNASHSSIIVCRTAAGTDCEVVGFEQTLALDPLMVGRYLFAETRHFFSSGQMYGVMPGPTADLDLDVGKPLVAYSRPSGPVTGPVAVDLWSKPARRGKRLTLGRVRCDRPCRVDLNIRDTEGHVVRRQWRRSGTIATRKRLGKALVVQVQVDGRQTLSRVITR